MAIFGRSAVTHILKTERKVVRTRQHWVKLFLPTAQTLLGVIVLQLISWWIGNTFTDPWFLQSVLWYGSLFLIGRGAWYGLHWWYWVLFITDVRFALVQGVLDEANSMMPLTKVTDMKFTQPLIGRIFGYGTLRIESAGQKQDLETITLIPDFPAFEEVVTKLKFGQGSEHKSSSLPPKRRRGRRKPPAPKTMDEVSNEWESDGTEDDD